MVSVSLTIAADWTSMWSTGGVVVVFVVVFVVEEDEVVVLEVGKTKGVWVCPPTG
jgi:hypothetical protein